MGLCENIIHIYNIIYEKIFNNNDTNLKNDTDKSREKNANKNREKNIKKDNEIIKTESDFKSQNDYDNYLIQNDLLCIICFSPLLNDIKYLNCCHKYHKKCLNKWKKYKKVCPICKTNI